MPKIGMGEITHVLRSRLRFLDGVTLNGGEAILHRELGAFLREMRFQGAKVNIKTNASRPRAIQYVIEENLVDYIRVFIPAPFSKYLEVINYKQNLDEVKRAIQIIRKSSVPNEFSVKPIPGLVEQSDVLEIARFLSGSRRLVIERFDPSSVLDPSRCGSDVYSDEELNEISESVRPYFGEVHLSL
jgi:pyruvate formate lyase activating enzyme